MIPKFLAQRIVIGKMTFDEVPDSLKESVAQILIEDGMGELVPEAYRH